MAYIPPTGSVVAFQSDPTKLTGTVSVIGSLGITGNPSISGTVQVGNFPTTQNVSGSVVAFGFPTNQNVSGSVVAFQGTSPWLTVPTSGSVIANQGGTRITSLVSTVPSSVIVGTSIFGQLPAGTAVLGSVATLQGTNPWKTVPTSGSVTALQGGTRITSVVGSIPSSLLTGNYGHRNDAVASFLGGNLTWRPLATDSAGRTLTKPFAPEESRIEGYHSVVSTSVTTLVAAAGAGLKNYITDIVLVNTGATTTLVTFHSGGGTSILGYGIAPAGGGSNMLGFATPMRTLANETFDFQPTSASSILYVKVSGFKAP